MSKYETRREETTAIKRALRAVGINAKVAHGKGTAWGWVGIYIGSGEQFGEHVGSANKVTEVYEPCPRDCPGCRNLLAMSALALRVVQDETGRSGEYSGRINIHTQGTWSDKEGRTIPIEHPDWILPACETCGSWIRTGEWTGDCTDPHEEWSSGPDDAGAYPETHPEDGETCDRWKLRGPETETNGSGPLEKSSQDRTSSAKTSEDPTIGPGERFGGQPPLAPGCATTAEPDRETLGHSEKAGLKATELSTAQAIASPGPEEVGGDREGDEFCDTCARWIGEDGAVCGECIGWRVGPMLAEKVTEGKRRCAHPDGNLWKERTEETESIRRKLIDHRRGVVREREREPEEREETETMRLARERERIERDIEKDVETARKHKENAERRRRHRIGEADTIEIHLMMVSTHLAEASKRLVVKSKSPEELDVYLEATKHIETDLLGISERILAELGSERVEETRLLETGWVPDYGETASLLLGSGWVPHHNKIDEQATEGVSCPICKSQVNYTGFRIGPTGEHGGARYKAWLICTECDIFQEI